MISLVQPLPVGNALRLFLTPPSGATSWRVLRRTADAITGPDDTGAVVVVDQCSDNVVLDALALENDVPYHYGVFYMGAGAWLDSTDQAVGTPAATYVGRGPDPQDIVIARLEAGLAVEVARGTLVPAKGRKDIQVVRAPFMLEGNVLFPCVSVHLEGTGPDKHVVGDVVLPDELGGDGMVGLSSGWLARTRLNIAAASLNPDERIALRKALVRIVLANMPVFDGLGLAEVEFSQTDNEEFETKGAPLFFSVGNFSCVHGTWVEDEQPAVTDVTAIAMTYPYQTR